MLTNLVGIDALRLHVSCFYIADRGDDARGTEHGAFLTTTPDGLYLSFEAFARLYPPTKGRRRQNSSIYVWLGYYVEKVGRGKFGLSFSAGIWSRPFGIDRAGDFDYGHQFPSESHAWRQIVGALNKSRHNALDDLTRLSRSSDRLQRKKIELQRKALKALSLN